VKHEEQRHGQHGIEIAHLVGGEVISVRALTVRTQRRAALAAGATVLGVSALAALATGALLHGLGRVVHALTFVGVWSALGATLAAIAARRASSRAGRYLVGVDIDDDAYAPFERVLVRRAWRRGVRRAWRGYDLDLGPGMRGVVEGGRAPLDVESLVRAGRTRIRLDVGTRAEVTVAATTFVVRARTLADLGTPATLPRGFWRPFARWALVPLELAAALVFLRSVPLRAPIGEADMKSAIPADATPWEVEKLLREEAQSQSRTLHACFDPLPLTCQHPGYVGVGLSLARDGEIRTSWIARSTYGRDCPVEACMSNVISTWFFEPLPESMRIVLPVQVLRTDKPLPVHAALARGRNEAPEQVPTAVRGEVLP
jgi:hypothetical protein